jgi:hypothetical protein
MAIPAGVGSYAGITLGRNIGGSRSEKTDRSKPAN